MFLSNFRENPLDCLPFFQLILLTMPWIGVGALYAVLLGITTPMLEIYGLKGSLASLVWIISPLTSFFVAPVIGAMSDNCKSKYGRRRPFILIGYVALLIGYAVLLFTYAMGEYKISICLICMVIISIAGNIIQTPFRAYNADLVPESQQVVVQLLTTLFQICGGMLGTGLMRVFWTGRDPSELPKLTGSLVLIGSFLLWITCFTMNETPLRNSLPKSNTSVTLEYFQTTISVLKSIPYMSMGMKQICGICFCSWMALYVWNPTPSTWFARNVYSGCIPSDPSCTEAGQALFQLGTSMFTLSGIYRSLLTMGMTLIIAVYMVVFKNSTIRIPYALGLLIGSVALILAKFGPAMPEVAFGIAVCMGIPRAVAGLFPFAIIGKMHAEQSHSDVGRDYGILSIFINLAQLLITFTISGFRAMLGNDGLPWALFIAGMMLGLSAVMVIFLNENHNTSGSS